MGKKLIRKIRDNCAILCVKSIEGLKNGLLMRNFMRGAIDDSMWVSGSGVIFTKHRGNTEPIDLGLGI